MINVLIALVMPAVIFLVGVAVNFGSLVDTKIKLQIAADRAVFVGAAKLAHIMNKISEENWEVYKAFLKVDKNFGPNSQQSVNECMSRVKEMENAQTAARYERIEDMLGSAYEEAHAVARSVAAENFQGVQYEEIYGRSGKKLFEVLDGGGSVVDEEGDEIRRTIVCSNISGIVFDPKSVESKENKNLLKYYYGDREYVALVSGLEADFSAPLAPDFFGKIRLKAVAAAQPYGGSVKRFGLLAKEWEGKSLEQVKKDAEDQSKDGGRALWFRPALVPVEVALESAGVGRTDEIYLH